ncbi:MAG TPA: hypothetical protein VKB76_07870, partial [Ktedonobacterales bacterium]|nr:hypothetical protein [Ktedonobacterales bacterium]
IDHQLNRPGCELVWATPDIMNVRVEHFTDLPLLKRPLRNGWICRLHVPPGEDAANSELVSTQYQHIDVIMGSSLPPKKQIDSPSAGDPPGKKSAERKNTETC